VIGKAKLQDIENQFIMIAGRSEEHEVFVGSHSCSGADPSGPARKLKKTLARGRTSRDGNSQVAAFSKWTQRGQASLISSLKHRQISWELP